jgi:hypothetical protein
MKTKAYPKGCPKCWELFNKSHALALKKKEDGQAQKGDVLNPKGKNQHGDIHHYARSKLKKGKTLVDRLDIISKGEAAGSTVKDELAATQLLYRMIKDDEQDDKPQDIRVLILDARGVPFEDYKKNINSE